VKGVRLDAIGNSPFVLLADKEGKKALPIWIGLLEAGAIDKELRNDTSARPMTHDLLYAILGQTHVKVKEVKIVGLKNNIYYAVLFLKINKGIIEVDARPSDAIVIALKSKTPIFVATKILDDQGIAKTGQDRFAVAKRLIGALCAEGVAPERIFLDPLIQPISVQNDFGLIAIEVIRRVKQEFPHVNTTCGLSNISFGLPERAKLNRIFLTMAMAAGLDSAILDPLDHELMDAIKASNALLGRDMLHSKLN